MGADAVDASSTTSTILSHLPTFLAGVASAVLGFEYRARRARREDREGALAEVEEGILILVGLRQELRAAGLPLSVASIENLGSAAAVITDSLRIYARAVPPPTTDRIRTAAVRLQVLLDGWRMDPRDAGIRDAIDATVSELAAMVRRG